VAASRIDFFHFDSMDAVSYEPICRWLDRGVMVAPTDGALDFARAEAYLRQRGLPFQTEPSGDASAVVATQYFWTLGRPEYKRVPAFRLMYSLSEKGGAAHGKEWSESFDAVLCPGPYSARQLRRWGIRAIIVGFPKYDDYFRGAYRANGLRAKLDLDPQRRCAVYLPTWGRHSSADKFAAAIRDLARRGEYQVLYKPHTVTTRLERDRIDCFRAEIEAGQVVCLEQQINMAELFDVADVVLADGLSGALWEALIATDLPVVALHVHGDFERVALDGRVEEFARVCDEPALLRACMDRAMRAPMLAPARRAALADDLVSYRDGTSGQRAAQVIAELTEAEGQRPWGAAKREWRWWRSRAVRGARGSRWFQRLRHPLRTLRNGVRHLPRGETAHRALTKP
jgi:hypothetical protein